MRCEKCKKNYDDARSWTICPHHSLEWGVHGPDGPPKKAEPEQEMWEGHQMVRLAKEITGPIPEGVLVAVSVAVLIRNWGGKVIAIASMRGDLPVWEFAGGKVDAGEDSRQAAVREIKEELGLDIEVTDHVTSMMVLRGDKSYVMQFYLAEIAAGSGSPKPSAREVSKVEYLDVEEPLPTDRNWWPATKLVWDDIGRVAMKAKYGEFNEGTFVLITTEEGSRVAQITAEDTDDPANTSVVYFPSGKNQLMDNKELSPIDNDLKADVALTYLFKCVRKDMERWGHLLQYLEHTKACACHEDGHEGYSMRLCDCGLDKLLGK